MADLLIKGPIGADLTASVISEFAGDKSCGAYSLFLGQVREDEINGKKVEAIEYSAYDSMVEKEAARIEEIVHKAFSDIKKIRILHSTGIVKTGEISLLVIVSAGHRDQATRACRHILEMIKENYPVWKKELFGDDSHRWLT